MQMSEHEYKQKGVKMQWRYTRALQNYSDHCVMTWPSSLPPNFLHLERKCSAAPEVQYVV
jgi:hypothetical protein